MIITEKTVLNSKQSNAYEKTKFLANRYFIYTLETNPSGRQYIKAILEHNNRIVNVIIVDVESCEWVCDEKDIIRYESLNDIILVKLLEDKYPLWLKKGTLTGEDEKGWYYIEDNKKIYRYIKKETEEI